MSWGWRMLKERYRVTNAECRGLPGEGPKLMVPKREPFQREISRCEYRSDVRVAHEEFT